MFAHFTTLAAITAASLVLASGCGRSTVTPKVVPAATAYTDGFEVVVFDAASDGSPTNVQSLHLSEAEAAIAGGSAALVRNGEAASLEQSLAVGHTGDWRATIKVTPIDAETQTVCVAIRESKRTYAYEYRVAGSSVVPMSSSYRDLRTSNGVTYAPANDASSSTSRPTSSSSL